MQTSQAVERCFFPSVEKCVLTDDCKISLSKPSTIKKIIHYTTNFFKCPFVILFGTILSGINLTTSIVTYPIRKIFCKNDTEKYLVKPTAFQSDEQIQKLIAFWLPQYDGKDSKDYGIGFATSSFQDCGLGTKLSKPMFDGTCNWDKWIPQKIHMSKNEDKFINYLDHPKDLISHLRKLNVSTYRISLERSVLEPAQGKFNLEAIRKYKNLFKLLNKNKIKPLITLHHFVDPQWFEDIGRFEKEENIDSFVNYSLTMIDTFKDVVDCYMTFNELAIYVFQTYIRKVYPIKGHESIFQAGNVLKNLLLAHVKIFRKTKEKYGDAIKIGVTHQWLKITPNNPNNPIERLICYFLAKLTHKPVYDFFKRQKNNTYKFEYKLPGISNIEMEIADDKNIGITDFIGVQNYGYPIFKFGFNEGKPLPGMIKNFKFPFLNFGFSVGSTSKKGGIVSSFGPPFSPEAMIDCLLEAKDANCPLLISETGYDAKVQHFSKPKFEIDQKVQKKAYEVIFAIIALVRCDNFSHKIILRNHLINLINQPQNIELIRKIDQLCFSKIDLKGCTFWTLFKNFEWENGWGNTRLDINDVKTNSEGRIASSKMNLTGKYVQQMCLLKKNLTRSDLKELSA